MYEVNLLKSGTISDLGRKIKGSPLPLNTLAISLAFTALFCCSVFITTGFYLPRKRFIQSFSVKEGKITQQIMAVRRERSVAQGKIDQLTNFKKEDIVWSEKLRDLSLAVPEGIVIEQIKTEDIANTEKLRKRKFKGAEVQKSSKKTYNLFGSQITKPKKSLYISGVIDVRRGPSPLTILNSFIDNLVRNESFTRDFEILDWRLTGEENTSSFGNRRSVRRFKNRLRGRALPADEKTDIGFELELGIKVGVSSSDRSRSATQRAERFFDAITQ